MPSRKPRLILTVPDPLMAAIRDLSDAMGKPMATVVVGLLEELQPQLQDLAKLVRQAKSGRKAAVKRTLVHMVGDAAAALLTAQQGEMFKGKR